MKKKSKFWSTARSREQVHSVVKLALNDVWDASDLSAAGAAPKRFRGSNIPRPEEIVVDPNSHRVEKLLCRGKGEIKFPTAPHTCP